VALIAGLQVNVVRWARDVARTLEDKQETTKRELGGSIDSVPDELAELPLFVTQSKPEEHPVIKELRDVDLMNMTPLDLMQRVDAWQKRLKGGTDTTE